MEGRQRLLPRVSLSLFGSRTSTRRCHQPFLRFFQPIADLISFLLVCGGNWSHRGRRRPTCRRFPQAALRLHDCLLPAPQTDFRETRRLSGLVHSLLARVVWSIPRKCHRPLCCLIGMNVPLPSLLARHRSIIMHCGPAPCFFLKSPHTGRRHTHSPITQHGTPVFQDVESHVYLVRVNV
jgi:hypothetical protein